MGGQGCTFGVDSMVGAVASGFDAEEIDLLIAEMLEAGTARQQGIWVVLDESVCTIRLPDVDSPLTTQSPEILAIAPYIDERTEYDGGYVVEDEGCFLNDPLTIFRDLHAGDEDAANAAYLAFTAAAISVGELRFYSPSALVTPRSWQITTGECALAPNMDAINASKPFIASGFGTFVREIGAITECGDRLSSEATRIGLSIQGVDLSETPDFQNRDGLLNAHLGFEMHVIAMGAGWYEGMSAAETGTPRPPLCHYPDG